MKEHTTHSDPQPEVIENYKEEGLLTVEALDIASRGTTTGDRHKHEKKGFAFALTTPTAILLGAIIVAVGILGAGLLVRGSQSVSTGGDQLADTAPSALFKGRPIDSSDYVEGKTNSKIVVVEYSDPECPFCVSVYPTMKKLRTEYADKVAFVYRFFPLTSIHPHAFDESRAIACAGSLGGGKALYAYIDTLYGNKAAKQNPTTLQFPPLAQDGKEAIAKSIGLDVNQFSSCMSNKAAADTVNASIADGAAAGVQGTPTTYVLSKNNKGYEVVATIDGARPANYFEAAIDQALSK